MVNDSSNINELLISLNKIDGYYNLKYFSFHLFYYWFYQILFCLHPAFHAEVSQLVCKPNQITEFCVIPMTQEIYQIARNTDWKLVNARNKINQHRSNYQKVSKKKWQNIM